MKKILLFIAISLIGFMAKAQTYETIKNTVILTQYKKAKEDIDKAWSNAKFTSKPEAYILKTTIYGALATGLMNINIGMSKNDVIARLGQPKNTSTTTTSNGTNEMLFYDDIGYTINLDEKGKVDWINKSGNNSGVKGTNAMLIKMDELTDEGDAAFKKYKEMDPSMSLLTDLVYQNGPINLYSSYYTSGYNDYSTKKWDAGYNKLKKAVTYSDLLIEKKLLTAAVDTNVLILAGITAEKSNHKDEAAMYYSRLADHKITGDGFESVYRFLVSYYFGKKDYASFEKYKALGREVYPRSEFFTFDKIDFAVGLETTLSGKIKAVEEVLVTDPNNYKANEWMGEIIYRAFYPLKDDVPESFDTVAMELKMINAFNKAATAQPDSIDAFLYLGDHYYNRSEKINDKRAAHAADMKQRTKPGTMASKEDVARRDLLDKQYGEALEIERVPYEKAAAIFAAKSSLSIREKAQYRNLAGKIADVYTFKKIQAKGKPADAAKYEAEEKKWNATYESIK